MEPTRLLPLLLGTAWLLPLASFTLIVLLGPRMGKAGRCAAYVATTAILLGCVLSVTALGVWVANHPLTEAAIHAGAAEAAHEHTLTPAAPVAGEWYVLGQFGALRMSIGYHIDALTVAMFAMVTFIASCIHFYSMGYMHEELHDVTDSLVKLADGREFVRPGRYHRFFQYLSLFCFSMLGLVIAGNVLMVFVFWELVGVCSYFLIGFYVERKSASNAANKAFIVNRVGDFGMIIGLMAIWTGLGTFNFDDTLDDHGQVTRQGIFSMVRPVEHEHALRVPEGMIRASAAGEIAKIVEHAPDNAAAIQAVDAKIETWRQQGFGYWLLVVAGLGIFCGCVGKSAQFPLHVWLPDAMEGPTPVSALIHAATMVAAGVYLVGRFYPVFTPEVLLVIAYTGCITLFIAATIAIVATDIKRVLAYSTVSQLGYMMLALGVGGWLAGLFHLFTHAFFKALLFLCSGSVIHATGTNEMPQMGGLWKKMPYTAWTMLVGCLAIAGAGIPWVIGLSGYYSKDSILAQVWSFKNHNPAHAWLFYAAAGGAAITAFYMFRLWCMTFAGKPRDHHVYDHAHESPATMYVPLVILATMSVIVGWPVLRFTQLLEQARPIGTAAGHAGGWLVWNLVLPAEHLSHESGIHNLITLIAFLTALTGASMAIAFYGFRVVDVEEARRQFAPLHTFLRNKWYFDELYGFLFVRPVLAISRFVAGIDRHGIDRLADSAARLVRGVSQLDDWIDRTFVDGLVNLTARVVFGVGLWLRTLQTGNLRQYVMFIVVGTVALFVLISLYWNIAVASG